MIYVPTKGGVFENPRILKISWFSSLVNYKNICPPIDLMNPDLQDKNRDDFSWFSVGLVGDYRSLKYKRTMGGDWHPTVDGSEIRRENQLKLVVRCTVYPRWFAGFLPSTVAWG